jgi:hypothetical protein
MVLRTGNHDTIRLDPRDQFGNAIQVSDLEELSLKLSVSVFRYFIASGARSFCPLAILSTIDFFQGREKNEVGIGEWVNLR